MIKYAIDVVQMNDLLKLGVCNNEDEARELVSKGKAELLIKEARHKSSGAAAPKEGTS